jgi:hypothetical protein
MKYEYPLMQMNLGISAKQGWLSKVVHKPMT